MGHFRGQSAVLPTRSVSLLEDLHGVVLAQHSMVRTLCAQLASHELPAGQWIPEGLGPDPASEAARRADEHLAEVTRRVLIASGEGIEQESARLGGLWREQLGSSQRPSAAIAYELEELRELARYGVARDFDRYAELHLSECEQRSSSLDDLHESLTKMLSCLEEDSVEQ